MGRPGSDHHIALHHHHHHHHSSIALLQERFRQLQRVKEMRQERELLKTLSSSPSSSSSSSHTHHHHHRDQMHYEPLKNKAVFHTDLFFPPAATKPSSQLSLSLWPPASSPESCFRPGVPQSSAGSHRIADKKRINDINLAHNSSTLPRLMIKHDHEPFPDVDTSLHL